MRQVVIAALVLACAPAVASEVKLRELIHPFPPAGPTEVAGTAASDKVLRTMQRYAVPAFTDVLAMHVAQTLQGASDEPVKVTRKPRQGGREAVAAVALAPADGRTLLLGSGATAPVLATQRFAEPVDVRLRPVAVVASMPYVLIATTESRYQKAGDVVDTAHGAPSPALIGSPGERSAAHFAIDRLRSLPRASIQPVAYNGGVNALQAVVSGQVSAAVVPLPAVLPYLAGGRLKVLAITESQRHPSIPRVATNGEAGLPALEATSWFAVFAPAATSPAVIHELAVRLSRGAQSAETREVFSELGLRLESAAETQSDQRGTTGISSRDAFRPPS
jgi:tripartite-type tricarboxylate transporter receptor subunit TctC